MKHVSFVQAVMEALPVNLDDRGRSHSNISVLDVAAVIAKVSDRL